MEYFSTRNSAHRVSPAEAIRRGLAPDGGLYMPAEFPPFPMAELPRMSVAEIAVSVLSRLFDDFSEEELSRAVHAAYDGAFPGGDIAPLHTLSRVRVMELFHGPTCAFKDVALSLLPHLLTAAARKCGVNEEICILTATSGDTGSAALSGFSDVAGTRVFVFYPENGVSPTQRKQMVTCPGKNTAVCAVKGNFDDAQSGVKAIFASCPPPRGMRWSSANSINIGRLAPQVTYYFKAYRDLLADGSIVPGERVNFVVPTGNFGDILAGYFAGQMGLPVGRLICASNANRVLYDFFRTGCYDRRREFHLTQSPSMDILVSSNLERLLYLFCGAEETAAMMKELKEKGVYTVSRAAHTAMQREFFAGWADDARTADVIREVYRTEGYLMDPHTAVGYAAYLDFLTSGVADRAVTVLLATASPFKFSSAVLQALGEDGGTGDETDMERLSRLSGAPIPPPLAALHDLPVRHTAHCRPDEMADFIRNVTEGQS